MIKIGFGPKVTANSYTQSGVKVSRVLNEYEGYACDCFADMSYDALSGFDVLVFIKIIPDYETLKKLKADGKILILDYHDMFLMPSVYEQSPFKKNLKKLIYCSLERKKKKMFALFDRCLISSPALEGPVREAGIEPHFLMRQIFNDTNEKHYKQHTERTANLKLMWTGVDLNFKQNTAIMPCLENICRKYEAKIIYLTSADLPDTEFIEYRKWSVDTWEESLLEGDIAFRWWDVGNDQYFKDPNKVLAYMAAGLPVVCKPTPSERLIIDQGKTGFMAETVEEFEKHITELIENPQLRRMVSEQAHQEVWEKYSLRAHVGELVKMMEGLIGFKGLRA